MPSTTLRAALSPLVAGHFARWLEQQRPPSSLIEVLELLRQAHEVCLAPEFDSRPLAPLLELLLGHPWLQRRYMPEAVHDELEALDEVLGRLSVRD